MSGFNESWYNRRSNIPLNGSLNYTPKDQCQCIITSLVPSSQSKTYNVSIVT